MISKTSKRVSKIISKIISKVSVQKYRHLVVSFSNYLCLIIFIICISTVGSRASPMTCQSAVIGRLATLNTLCSPGMKITSASKETPAANAHVR